MFFFLVLMSSRIAPYFAWHVVASSRPLFANVNMPQVGAFGRMSDDATEVDRLIGSLDK